MERNEKCPFCGAECIGDDSMEGQNVTCPNCQKGFVFGHIPAGATLESDAPKTSPIKTTHLPLSATCIKNELRILIASVIIFGSLICFMLNKSSRGNFVPGTSLEPIVDYKVVYYAWDKGSVAEQLNKTIQEGYEPVGYLCANGTSGGALLFVKRGKADSKIRGIDDVAYSSKRSHFAEMQKMQIQPKAFQATMPSSPTELYVYASLSDFYLYGYRDLKADWYSIYMGDYGYGYVTRNSKCGRMLYDLLKDGKEHKVIVHVKHTWRSQGNGSYFDILSATTDGVDK